MNVKMNLNNELKNKSEINNKNNEEIIKKVEEKNIELNKEIEIIKLKLNDYELKEEKLKKTENENEI